MKWCRQDRALRGLLCVALLAGVAGTSAVRLSAQTLYNGIVLPQPWPPVQTPTQTFQLPSYITNPPSVIRIDLGRQLFVDDFLIQQTTMTRTQHQPVMYPLNPIITPNQNDISGFAMPFSGGVWFDPVDKFFKAFLFCGGGPAKVCYDYSTDGKSWIRPSIPDAFVPNTDEVQQSGMVIWMDLEDPNPARKFKLFTWDTSMTNVWYSQDGIHWTGTNLHWPLVYDRTTLFWNPFRKVWVDSMKNEVTLPATAGRAAYLSRIRNYAESPDLTAWTPAQPQNFGTSFWTGPDANDPPYTPGGTFPHLYNLDAVAYESVMVGLFSWFYGGGLDDNPANLPGPDLVELGAGFSRDGFQWVRPTRGSGPGPNGAFIAASNVAGTWNMGNTQSAGGGFLVVGDELWFYFSGRTGLHDDPTAIGATGLATLRRDGFYSMNAGSTAATLTTRPVQFTGKYLFVNVKDPQGSLQVQVVNPANNAVLATSLPLTTDKTLQQVNWSNNLADLSGFANQPVQFRFTLTNGELYSFWVSATTAGASNGYVAANGPGFTGPTDNLGTGAYPTAVATPEIYPPSGVVSSATNIKIVNRTLGATVYYTIDGSMPSSASALYSGPIHLAVGGTVKAIAIAPGLSNSTIASATFTVNNTAPLVSITSQTNGQTVASTIALTASVTDILPITGVQFLADGVSVGTVTTSPYTISLQTTTLTNTTHQLTAVATDSVGNRGTSAPVTVTVANVTTGPVSGLVGYWSFDAAYVSGTTLLDQSGYNNNAVATSTTSLLGETGQALQFNGASSLIQVPSSLSTQAFDLLGDLSLSLWVQTTNASRYEGLISKYAAGGAGSGYLLRTTAAGTAELLFGVANVASASTVATDVTKINDGHWHNITAVIKLGTSVTFYVDGVLSSATSITTVAGFSATFLEMGVNPYTPYGSYFTGNMDEVRVYDRALTAADVNALFLAVPITQAPPPSASAVFVKIDTTTLGNWKGTYGQDGFTIALDSNSLPSYAGVNFTGAAPYLWAASTMDPRALLKGASLTDRIASTFYSATSFSIDVNLTDGQTHQVALYCVDWEGSGRTQRIDVLDAQTQTVLNSQSLSSFSTAPPYLVWNLKGHVTVRVVMTGGVNAVVSGVFFDPPGSGGVSQYQLTTSAAGGGSIVANPVSASGFYNSGTSVQLTATPNTGCAFINWSGDLSGNANPQAITMSATHSVSATFQCGTPGPGFVTGFVSNGVILRNNFTGFAGMKFTVGANALNVSALGRLFVAGNSGAHVVKLVRASDGADVPGGSVSVPMAGGTSGLFSYATLASPVTLLANTSYCLVSQEFSGGDQWYDHGPVTSTNDGVVSSSIYYDGTNWIAVSTANTSYIPPNFQYSVVSNTTAVVTVQASPTGPAFSVDGTSYTTPQTQSWPFGSTHTLAVTSPQSIGTGSQYAWTGWSDGGSISHTVSPASSANFTASFTTQYLLSTNVSPSGGGSIAANPASASGYYNNGTPVQLTATPGSGCTFTNWTGDITGSVNPQTLTMAVPRTVSANFQCSGPPATSFLSAFSPNGTPIRNNFTGWVGMKLTTGGSSLNVASIGRLCVAGNSGTHIVKFVNAATGIDVPGGSATANMSQCAAGQFVYGAPSGTTVLQPNASYYLVSQEVNGADQWYDHGGVSPTSDAAVNSSIYSPDGASWIAASLVNTSYVPPNFLYSLPPPSPADLTIAKSHSAGFTQGDIGDTYTITVTNSGLSATSGAVSVADAIPTGLVATGIAGTGWTCAQPAGPCTRSDALNAGGSYPSITVTVNVASNAPASLTNTATVSGGGETNTANDTANDLTTVAALISVTVQTSPSGASFSVDGTTYTATQGFSWKAGSSHTIATTSPQSVASGIQNVWSSWSDTGAISHTVSPTIATTFTAAFATQYLLSSTVLPVGGGGIGANVPSGTGYYASGTVVQLTATQSAGYLFANWSGDLTGSVNPQSVTMSAPRTVTANFQALTPAITGFALNGPPLRNNFTGYVGMKLTLGSNALIVATLGRVCVAGNSGIHTVKFVRASTGVDVSGGSVTLNMSGCAAGQYLYGSLASPITLQAYTAYYLVSQETAGGDFWYDYGTLSAASTIAVNNSIYSNGASWVAANNANTSYVPPGFQYVLGPPDTSLITSFNPAGVAARNNFTGWVGMKLTVGASNVTVSSLGRIFVAGNSGTHVIKLVRASDGTDVAGGSASVSMVGGTAGQFSYATLASPVTLLANTSYYLVSQELLGGDQWYDFAPVVTTSAAAVNNAVYSSDSKSWTMNGNANMSYVPPNMK